MNKEKGNVGEKIAKFFLSKKGFKIISSNYFSRHGEIDIVAVDGGCLVFVEVKLRKSESIVSGREAVNLNKRKRLIKTALVYISELKKDIQTRFDVVEINGISTKDKKAVSVLHLKNAFSLDDVGLIAA